MSHPEVDRRSSEHQAVRNTLRPENITTDIIERTATRIDANLDNGVLDIQTLNADGTAIAIGIDDPAIYYATDPDADETADLEWKLEGPDKDWLKITKGDVEDNAGLSATLAFDEAPDWEMPRDKPRNNSNNNVYEVTLVVTTRTAVCRTSCL